MDIQNKKIAVIGCGRSGLALSRLILRLGAKPKVSELGSASAIFADIQRAGLEGKIDLQSDGHTQDFICDSDAVVISPGVRKDAVPVKWALDAGLAVFSEIEFSWMFCCNPVVAITGSNGKTTVSTLIHGLFESAGKKARLCGNIGSPFAAHVLDLSPEETVVLEISSFQLEWIKTFAPHVAVLLNCTQNHLDRHKDMHEYFSTKVKIFENQNSSDFAILNYEDEKIRILKNHICAKPLYYNGPSEKEKYPHDNLNFLAARKVAHLFSITDERIDAFFNNFSGVEHRLERVRTLNGIEFINDSKATTAEAGLWALSQMHKPVILICGGRDKNMDFSVLRELIQEKVKKLVLIGEARKKMRGTFVHLIDISEADSLEEAVQGAYQSACEGDCVLFSPLCASFDMFRNFEERGQIFKNIVNQL